ncbi:hypothetical protein EON77_15970 [bacterium]|nr:MAG: hypothetical protein EON77_15970 [bacterium]
MLSGLLALASVSLPPPAIRSLPAPAARQGQARGTVSGPVAEASPFVGTDGHGHAFPGATAPFGMVQLSPDTRTDTWDGSSGYHYSDSKILGFSHTHLSGTGIGCMGDIMVMPYLAANGADLGAKTDVSSRFSHTRESATPGSYSVHLDDAKAQVELTATSRAGMHRITFDQSAPGTRTLVVDLDHSIQNDTIDTLLTVENPTTLSGWRKSRGWGGERTVFFVMQLSKPMKSLSPASGAIAGRGGMTEISGKVRAYVTLPDDSVVVKVGISATGVEGARKNLDTEISGWDFDAVRDATQAV